MKDTASELMTRRQFLKELELSDSTERRGRTGGGEWPPHLLIGKKVYYRRESLDDWLRHREAATQSAAGELAESQSDAAGVATK